MKSTVGTFQRRGREGIERRRDDSASSSYPKKNKLALTYIVAQVKVQAEGMNDVTMEE